MSAEVHRLTPAGPIIEPESEVIEKLSHLLEKAQRGEIKGIGFFYVTGDNGTVSGWTSRMCVCRPHDHWCFSSFPQSYEF